MALPTRDDLKQELRIEHDAEDDLIERDLAQAKALVEADIRQPIEARPFTLDLVTGYSMRLVYPIAPILPGGVVVENEDGEIVDDATYTVNAGRGWITAGTGTYFGTYAGERVYRVTAVAGLSLRDDYATAVEPAISRAILDYALDLYQRRNPAASYESSGGGISTNYNETASKTEPSRIKQNLAKWRRMLV